MARVKASEVESFISDDRFTVMDDDLNEQFEDRVLGQLEGRYDTSTWVDVDTTPDLVRQVIALLNAANILYKAYSDQEDGVPYADRLSNMAESMLLQIVDGTLNLTVGTVVITDDEYASASDAAGPAFYPTDTERLEENGVNRIKFEMGTVF